MVNRDKVEYRDTTPFDESKLQDLQVIKDAILHKQIGKDVRAPIAQIPDAIISALQVGADLGQTGALAELVAARGGFETLGLHEQAQDSQIESNIQNINFASQKSDDAVRLAKQMASGSPAGVFTKLTDLNTKYPNGAGGVYLVVENGHWYYWDSSSRKWTDGGKYQSQGIGDDSVTNEMISNVNFSKVQNTTIQTSKIKSWNNANVTINSHFFDIEATGGDMGAIVPFEVFAGEPSRLTYQLQVLDDSKLTGTLDLYSVASDGSTIEHKFQSVALANNSIATTLATDSSKSINYIAFVIHGTGSVRIRAQINANGDSRDLRQLSQDIDKLSVINDDIKNNLYNGNMGQFGNSNVTSTLTGWSAVLTGANGGMETDAFITDAKKVNIAIQGTKNFDALSIMLAIDNGSSVSYRKIGYITAGKFDTTISFNAKQLIADGAKAFRVVINSNGSNTSGSFLISRFEITPLDQLQTYDLYNINLRKMLINMLEFSENTNKINAIYDGDYNNLWNGDMGAFGSADVNNDSGSFIINVNGTNGGAKTPDYQSSGAKTKVHIKGSFTTQSVDVQVAYQTSSGTKYKKLGTITGGSLNNDFYFDAVNLAVYAGATAFATLIQCNDSNASGTIEIEELGEYVLSDLQANSLYDISMQKMLGKIINKLDDVSDSISTIQSDKNLYVTMPDGSQAKIVVNADGTLGTMGLVPTKTLLMGNSLALGLDTDNSRGGAFGMCATGSRKDYIHFVEQAILDHNSAAKFNKLHDAAFEQAETDADAQKYIDDNAGSFTNDLDLVTIQLGDNVNNAARVKTFRNNLPKLINKIKQNSPRAQIVLIGVWFDNYGVSDIIKQVAADQNCDYVSIDSLNTTANQATVGDTITFNDGSTMETPEKYATHPGDAGHKAIADRINDLLKL